MRDLSLYCIATVFNERKSYISISTAGTLRHVHKMNSDANDLHVKMDKPFASVDLRDRRH